MNHALSVIILSGGKSSRMGRDKAAIEIAGVPLLRRIAETALQVSDQVFVITTPEKEHKAILPATVAMILETNPQGPLFAFAQALTRVNSDWVLLLACDLPHVDLATVQQWIAMLNRVSRDAVAFLPKNLQGWWEPLCGFYRSNCLPSLDAFIQQEGRSFQDWLATQTVEELTIANPNVLLNCNTSDDLQRAIQNFPPPH